MAGLGGVGGSCFCGTDVVISALPVGAGTFGGAGGGVTGAAGVAATGEGGSSTGAADRCGAGASNTGERRPAAIANNSPRIFRNDACACACRSTNAD